MTLLDALRVGWQVWKGELGPRQQTQIFEEMLARRHKRTFAACTTSGTAALMLAIEALELPSGSTIAFPAYGMIAGANAAAFLGYRVQLVDVRESTMCMDPFALIQVEELPDAVIFVDHNGYAGEDLDNIWSYCQRHRIPLIEDACQAIGMPRACRTGCLATLSFSVPKLLTTGQGGCVLTDDQEYWERIQRVMDHGGGNWRRTRIHEALGVNLRFNDVLAALGVSQMRRLDRLLARRRTIRRWYRERIGLWGDLDDGWCVIYKSHAPNAMLNQLWADGIGAQQYYRPVNESAPFLCNGFPVARKLADSLIYLPSSLNLTRRQVRYICDSVRKWES